MSEDTCTRAIEQSHATTTTTLASPMAIILQEVEDIIMKKAIPAVVEAMRLQFDEGFKTFIPIMVDEVLKNLVHSSVTRPLPHNTKSSILKTLKLQFVGILPDTLLTFNNIEDEGASLEVELQDSSGSRVEIGPEASVKIKIVVLDGDFEVDDTDDWTHEDFERNVAQRRKDKGPLLKGKCEIYMTNGVARVTDIAFTDNSKSMRNGKFRLGARVAKGLPAGVRTRDGVSEALKVKERRVKSYRKHKSPSLEDGTYCLKNIGKTLCQKLADREINTVKDFLQLYHADANGLRNILQLAENKWSELANNAKLCSLSDQYYEYYGKASGVGILLDCAFNVAKVLSNGQVSQCYGDLADSEKKLVNKIRLAAYEKRKELPRIHSPTIPTSMQAESVCRSMVTHTDTHHLDVTVDDRTRLMPHLNLDNSSIVEGHNLRRISPERTEKVCTNHLLLSLLPSEPGALADQPQDGSFLGADGCINKRFRLGPTSDAQVVLHGTNNVPENSTSECNVKFKRPRLSSSY